MGLLKKIIFLCFVLNPLFAKSLDWDRVEVRAYLTKEGILEIEETQSIRFDGDWNGGYRDFKVSYGQIFTFEGIERKSESGKWISLTEGNIDLIDNYTYEPNEHHLRWRARNITDPPFADKLIEYRIRVKYSGILSKNWNGDFTLNHDFAFSDRKGDIRKFYLELNWDSVWKLSTSSESKLVFESDDISPGKGFVKKLAFKFNGKDTSLLSNPIWKTLGYRFLLLFVIPIILALFQLLLYLFCVKKGVFLEPYKIQDWTELKKILGDFTPEEIAILSEKGLTTSWLTRLVLEKKIRISKDKVIRIDRLVPVSEFSQADQSIIEKIFIDGCETITSEEIKQYYKSKGFSFSLFDSIESLAERSLENKGVLFSKKENPLLKFLFWVFDRPALIFFFFFGSVISIIFSYVVFLDPVFSKKGISGGVFGISCFIAIFISVVIGLFEDTHYGFFDLEHNRRDYFFGRYYRSLIPSILFAVCYLWILELNLEFQLLILTVSIIIGLQHLYRYSPHHFLRQITISLKALSIKNFFSYKLLFDKVCDISLEWSPYLAALDLAFSVKYRNDKYGDCAYLLPETFGNISISGTEANKNITLGNDLHSSSESSNFSGGGGEFGGGGASASWDDMSDFSSSSSYSPPSSSSSGSSGSSSSGGGGGGGW